MNGPAFHPAWLPQLCVWLLQRSAGGDPYNTDDMGDLLGALRTCVSLRQGGAAFVQGAAHLFVAVQDAGHDATQFAAAAKIMRDILQARSDGAGVVQELTSAGFEVQQ